MDLHRRKDFLVKKVPTTSAYFPQSDLYQYGVIIYKMFYKERVTGHSKIANHMIFIWFKVNLNTKFHPS